MSKSLQNMCEVRDSDVLTAFKDLNAYLKKFATLLVREHHSVSLVYETDRAPINVAIEALSALTYTDEQVGRELIQQPGVIFIPPELVEMVETINTKKNAFMAEIGKFKEASTLKTNEGILSQLRQNLASAGEGRIHIKQCERKFMIIEKPPKKLTWYTESGGWGAQKKFSKSEAQSLVDTMMEGNEDGIRVCTQLVNDLHEREILVKRSKSADSTKISAVYGERKASSHIGSLPIFVVVSSLEAISEVQIVMDRANSKKHGSKKSTSKFEAEPYIESLKLYRYKSMYRIPEDREQ